MTEKQKREALQMAKNMFSEWMTSRLNEGGLSREEIDIMLASGIAALTANGVIEKSEAEECRNYMLDNKFVRLDTKDGPLYYTDKTSFNTQIRKQGGMAQA